MDIVFRADASIHIGSGHVMRCLVLAQALQSRGHTVSFACRAQNGDLIDFLKQREIPVVEMNRPEKPMLPGHSADYQAWLQVPWQDDAYEFSQLCGKPDWVVVDHYGIGAEWETEVKAITGCQILAIDDLVRLHQAEFVLDQTLGRQEDEYRESSPTAEPLTGTHYALLKPGFSQHRDAVIDLKPSHDTFKLLLTMGGIDQPNATMKVLRALTSQIKPLQTTVLLSPRAPAYAEVKAFAEKHCAWVTHYDFIEDMPSLMAEHQVSIGAPGSTSWERACLGLPSIVIPLADNQNEICRQLVQANAALKISCEEIQTQLLTALEELLSQFESYRSNSLKLCDGRGVYRTVAVMEEPNGLRLRKASVDDIQQVYEWQRHPSTRQYALNTEIPEWQSHVSWMSKKLASLSDHFYIIDKNSIAKGGVRLDRQNKGHYLISIYVAPDSYGQGIASKAVALIDMLHPDFTIHATVLKENIPSQKLFASAGYERLDAEHFIRFPKVDYVL